MNLILSSSSTIRIAAALVIGKDGRTLLVRKQGTLAFMQPGGKIESNEEPETALIRELEEELGLTVTRSQAVYIGRFAAPAANEPGFVVVAELFLITNVAAVTPASEIEEIVWLDTTIDLNLPLAPLTKDYVLPLHRSMAMK
jgi:8-oxo-dGTP diphosphatase